MEQDKNIENIRHSLSHIMAQAVLELYPKIPTTKSSKIHDGKAIGTKLGMGPAIENGFYYDFALPAEALSVAKGEGGSDKFLQKIEEKMKELVLENQKFIKKNITKLAAKKLFKDQPYKLELIKDLPGKTVSIYTNTGCLQKFVDLCKGPHVKNTNEINPKAFKLTKIAGAYWKGSEKNKMLTRIYGLAFSTEKELQDYIKMQEEAEKRDHRKLGQKLELYMFHETAPGMAYWLPKGLIIFNELVNFWRAEHQKEGYQEIKSPLINKKELYQISGHWDHYKENMFVSETEEGEIYGLKPMNCPNAMVVYDSRPRSYKELPLRLSDSDTLHRFEKSGTLNGLLRVREFSQDDAHIFVKEEQIEEEYNRILAIIKKFYSIFNIEYSFRLGTRPKDFMGDAKSWSKAEDTLKNILEKSGKKYTIEKRDGAFYGPKIDILMKDSIGRDWQMGTIQLDFQIPKKFNLKYIDVDGKAKTPVVIHRVIYGSLERFIGILTEHLIGAFPVWLAPVQTVVIPISEKHDNYASEIVKQLKENNIRVELKNENETLGKKIREAEMQKIPYLLIAGDKEISTKTVSIRERGKGDVGTMAIDKFIEKIREEIKNKK
ncbi:MAG: threonine--tRNA ligase [Candidatus Staskawiczbacteria bacterium RIFCSPLOWO2_12_FULL_37_15]|uniref:Threonine--tRNA ligase n=1 Tax=Candidatus Staskawiczbacteria bacterium RIFCSPLOWO2_12_FULL_37_15 TaxID=1802218 RepID=A0A1G2ISK1_9BACT|nr:MAG: threonine--tRNA ligase [Candidatus Staskawiczbacteria bacterium RIFCSPLOWO2_12_FULL_37_15]